MPPRARCDRLAVEGALSPGMRAALVEVCETWGLRRDGWADVPALVQVFGISAALALAGRKIAAGASDRAAVAEAARELGMSAETTRSRIRRAFEDSYGVGALCTVPADGGGVRFHGNGSPPSPRGSR